MVVRIGRTGDSRWWLAAGLILGLGLANKHSVGLFAVALVAGALLSAAAGRLVLNRWFLAGAAIAVAFAVPDLWWQAQHEWATIAMTQALNRENGGLGNIGTWVIGQVIMVTLALVWVWLAGLRFLWRSRRPLWRALAWAYGLLFVLFAVTTGAKIYYLAGTYPYLLAAGFVAVDGWLAARPGRVRNLMLATALTTAAALPIVLPVLPAADVGWTYTVTGDSGESIGWPQLVQTVHTVWLSLPPAQRAHAVIFTANYGEAGAINELGRADGLPTAVSGHNTEWWWGPGNPRATTVVAVAPGGRPRLRRLPGSGSSPACSRWPRCRTRPGSATRNGAATSTCAPGRSPWAQLWPLLRHYD